MNCNILQHLLTFTVKICVNHMKINRRIYNKTCPCKFFVVDCWLRLIVAAPGGMRCFLWYALLVYLQASLIKWFKTCLTLSVYLFRKGDVQHIFLVSLYTDPVEFLSTFPLVLQLLCYSNYYYYNTEIFNYHIFPWIFLLI